MKEEKRRRESECGWKQNKNFSEERKTAMRPSMILAIVTVCDVFVVAAAICLCPFSHCITSVDAVVSLVHKWENKNETSLYYEKDN